MSDDHIGQKSRNLFHIARLSGPEDRFTAFWAEVLNRDLALAQAVVTQVAGDLAPSLGAVLMADDHPVYNGNDRPDFRLRCEYGDILFEHKLDAEVGPRQLERYLAIPTATPTWLAFVSLDLHTVPLKVLASDRYLRPQHQHHFLWEHFQPLVSTRPGGLTQEFAEHMGLLGMAPYRFPGIGAVFTDRGQPEEFASDLVAAAVDVFPVATISRDPSRTGITIKGWCSEFPLLHVKARKDRPEVLLEHGPVLSTWVFEPLGSESFIPSLDMLSDATRLVRRLHDARRDLPDKARRRGYLQPLETLLHENRAETRAALRRMLEAIREDLKGARFDGSDGSR